MSVKELVEKIKYNAQCYYEGHPEISDDEFDELVERLHCVDPDNPILLTTGWGYNPSGKKVTHIYGGMDSIKRKPRHITGIPDNFQSVRITPKFDGISGAAYYKDGKFYLGSTRGNGSVGIDCTDKMSIILGDCGKVIPNFTGAIRGEFIINNKNWKLYKEIHPDAKSQRNVVAGIINRNEIDEDIKYVDFIVYKIISCNLNYEMTANSVSAILDRYFDVSSSIYVMFDKCDLTQSHLNGFFDQFREYYPCDGVVITSNIIEVKDSKLIYDEVAYKFNGDTESTEVINIEWNRTRTGKMTPTIIFRPIDLDGATIRRCSGFNAKFIKDNGIGIGAEITIMRSGGVIPDCQEVIKPVEASIPDICPCCGEKLEWSGVDLKCTNTSCSGSDEADLYVWVNNIAPVHGLGNKMIEKFFEERQIETIEDMYPRNLTLDGTSATAIKLSQFWNKLQNEPVDAVSALVALNIPRLGWESAKKIVENNGMISIKHVLENIDTPRMPENELNMFNNIKSIVGEVTSKSIMKNINKLLRLKYIKDRIVINKQENPTTNSELRGEVVITGKLNTCKRSEFEKIITEAGYSLVPAVRKGVMYLITNTPNSGSSKNKKADELGIKKITEEEFLKLIK